MESLEGRALRNYIPADNKKIGSVQALWLGSSGLLPCKNVLRRPCKETGVRPPLPRPQHISHMLKGEGHSETDMCIYVQRLALPQRTSCKTPEDC